MKPILSAAALLTVLFSAQANAAAPNMQFGSDTRAMSNADCLSRAKFAMGEQHLQICATDGSDVAGCGASVTVLVTCFPVGARTFISVVSASPNPDVAGRFRNSIRSLVMGPAN